MCTFKCSWWRTVSNYEKNTHITVECKPPHPSSEFHGNPWSSFSVILLKNKPRGENITSFAVQTSTLDFQPHLVQNSSAHLPRLCCTYTGSCQADCRCPCLSPFEAWSREKVPTSSRRTVKQICRLDTRRKLQLPGDSTPCGLDSTGNPTVTR